MSSALGACMKVNTTLSIGGGCFCGAIRFAGHLDPRRVLNCHCEDCRRASGAPFVTWAGFERHQFQITRGNPKRFLKNNRIRCFCSDCGSQLLFFQSEDFPIIGVTVSSFDDPSLILPQRHIWVEDKIPWIKLSDGLPAHSQRPGA